MGASTSDDGDHERYHPGTDAMQQYEQAAGSVGPSDEQQQQAGLQPEAILQQGASGQYTPEEYALYCEQYYAWYGVDPPDVVQPEPSAPDDAPSSDRQPPLQGAVGKDDSDEAPGSEAALALIACYGSDSD